MMLILRNLTQNDAGLLDQFKHEISLERNSCDMAHIDLLENSKQYFVLEKNKIILGISMLSHETVNKMSWFILPEFHHDKSYEKFLIGETLQKSSKSVRVEVNAHNKQVREILESMGFDFLYEQMKVCHYLRMTLNINIDDFIECLKLAQEKLQINKIQQYKRHVSFGDLLTERDQNAQLYGFGEGTTCYDNVLILGNVKVGKNVWIGPNVILDGSGGLEIGDFACISAGVQIYTHDTVKRTISLGQSEVEYSPVKIGQGVYIGPNSIIQKGVSIGDRAIIGAMSFVNTDIPEGKKAYGIPARIQ